MGQDNVAKGGILVVRNEYTKAYPKELRELLLTIAPYVTDTPPEVWVERVIVTDRTRISHFDITPEELSEIQAKIGFRILNESYVHRITERMSRRITTENPCAAIAEEMLSNLRANVSATRCDNCDKLYHDHHSAENRCYTTDSTLTWKPKRLRDGAPCQHVGCLNHISHPCEGCGRIGGRSPQILEKEKLTPLPDFEPTQAIKHIAWINSASPRELVAGDLEELMCRRDQLRESRTKIEKLYVEVERLRGLLRLRDVKA